MRIAVLGTGHVGQALAGKLAELPPEAVSEAELIVNTTNGAGSISMLESAGEDALADKVLIDVANPLDFSGGMPPSISASTPNLGQLRIRRRRRRALRGEPRRGPWSRLAGGRDSPGSSTWGWQPSHWPSRTRCWNSNAGRSTIYSMAGVVRLVPLDDRGRQIIEELEEKAREQPTEIQEDGGRLYHLEGAGVGGEEFDAMLSDIDSEWQEHVTRTSSILP
jgi:hypothetical protein